MNHSYIIQRLNEWSVDKIRREDSGMGWPRKLPGYDGMPIGQGGGIYSPNISEDCFEVDKCVCALRVVDAMLYDTVMLTYIFRATTVEQKCKRLGFNSKQTYYNYLDRVHRMVQDFLTNLHIGEPLPVHIILKRA